MDDIAADLNLPRPIVAGGTGASSAAGARTALGLAIGTDVQAYDAATVKGPAIAVDARLAVFDGTTGKLLRDGGVTVAGLATAAQGTLADAAAPKASPALTGTPTAPTAAAGTNTTQIATTAFVKAAFLPAAEAVGTYVFASWPTSGAAKSIGDTVAGSTLRLASVSFTANNAAAYGGVTTTALSGTWELVGGWTATSNNQASLFRRIS